jgi:spoIIIJ-associated protein
MSDARTSLEVIAPTVEEAVAKGAHELGLDSDQLMVEVLDDGTKGLFGLGNRQARVRLTVLGRPARRPQKEVPEVEEFVPDDEDDAEAVVIARDTVIELLQRMNITADVHAVWGKVDPPGKIRPLHVDIQGKDLSVLIGRRGETLSALQYITRLIVGKELRRPVSIILDVEGYRQRREQQLRQLARRIAKQAIETQRTVALEPMPANERRIIHMELREDPSVETESIGEGNRRKVTVRPV